MHDDKTQKERDFRKGSREGDEVERRTKLDNPLASQAASFRAMFGAGETLPMPPKKAGWHYCWLTTTNPSDSPSKRMRIGYQPVKVEELPGFEDLRVTSGEFAGCVSVKEMLLFKIPEDVYQAIMAELHWQAPLDEIERLKRNRILPERDSGGMPVIRDVSEDLYGDRPRRVRTFE